MSNTWPTRSIAVAFLATFCLCACQSPPNTSTPGSPAKPVRTAPGPADAPRFPGGDVVAMSFNIRWPNPDDGDDRWDNRRDLVLRTIERSAPDVLGVQEAFAFQAEYLRARLPGYAMVGVGRDDGRQAGEMTAVYYREDRFELTDHGHLWLSDTPDVPGSVGWDAALTRMATWLVLDDRRGGVRYLVLNTHFDHVGRRARPESAKLIGRFVLEKQAELGEGPAVIVMGDFNSAIYSEAYLALTGDLRGPRLIDTYAATRSRFDREEQGTFSRFSGRTSGPRIDWLLVSNNLRVRDAAIVRHHEDGRYPSDHYPVTARLRVRR